MQSLLVEREVAAADIAAAGRQMSASRTSLVNQRARRARPKSFTRFRGVPRTRMRGVFDTATLLLDRGGRRVWTIAKVLVGLNRCWVGTIKGFFFSGIKAYFARGMSQHVFFLAGISWRFTGLRGSFYWAGS